MDDLLILNGGGPVRHAALPEDVDPDGRGLALCGAEGRRLREDGAVSCRRCLGRRAYRAMTANRVVVTEAYPLTHVTITDDSGVVVGRRSLSLGSVDDVTAESIIATAAERIAEAAR